MVNDAEQLVGVVFDRDIIRCLAESQDARTVLAGDVMTQGVEPVGEFDPLPHALERMDRSFKRTLPVVARDGRCVGMVSREDIARAMVHNSDEHDIRSF